MKEVVLLIKCAVMVENNTTLAKIVRDWPAIVDNCTVSRTLVDINPDLNNIQSEIDD